MGMILSNTEELLVVEKNQSSHTPDLPQPEITVSKQQRLGARLGNVPTNKLPLLQPELVGQKFSSVVIISPQVVLLGKKERRFRHVLVECENCGYRSIISYSNLTSGVSKGCRQCNQTDKRTPPYPSWLFARVTSMKTRCEKETHASYANYGGRGIRFEFDSPRAGAIWILENLGIPEDFRNLELDRIENDGNYAPGNLRWVTRARNMANRQNSAMIQKMHKFMLENPQVKYAAATLRQLLSAGMSFEEIVERYNKPSCKPKGKYGTSLIADPVIASLAKGS